MNAFAQHLSLVGIFANNLRHIKLNYLPKVTKAGCGTATTTTCNLRVPVQSCTSESFLHLPIYMSIINGVKVSLIPNVLCNTHSSICEIISTHIKVCIVISMCVYLNIYIFALVWILFFSPSPTSVSLCLLKSTTFFYFFSKSPILFEIGEDHNFTQCPGPA